MTRAESQNIVAGEHFRITVLTDRLLRLEYSECDAFTDKATQTVVCRKFPDVNYTVREINGRLELSTGHLRLSYDKKAFSPEGLSIHVMGDGAAGTWYYGEEPGDLGGTARTLDGVDGDTHVEHGPLSLGHGLMNRYQGYSILDDSRTMIVNSDRTMAIRGRETDLYFFGYGHRYLECLKDFYHLTGSTPLLPRFVLGNWWSRYHEYSQDEYEALIRHFEAEKIPLSVAIIDMDWHLVRIDPRYGTGWTGYTWNTDLFPDYRAFLNWLHEHGLRTALNIHPADGVRAYESMYPEMARAMQRDPDKGDLIPFDAADPAYEKAAFDTIFHPYEEDGVDFWWLDWQQGGVSTLPGLDPLWKLNDDFYHDSARDGRRGLTFSRYAGPGSHRYPIGFSGDTVMSWKSLDFQPYFTANASNIGYGWWSHDIGGHMQGYRDDELTARWIQFGVFSPIMRLHSSNNPFLHKEPWKLRDDYRQVAEKFLRLRHGLIPYLYSMNLRASREDRPIVEPLYYEEPENSNAYEHRNEYYFGSELLVAPITQPLDHSGTASVAAWIPDGNWYDFFSGHQYRGGKTLRLCRSIDSIPVLVREGGIIPMTRMDGQYYSSSTENPSALTIRVYPGRANTFVLWEDDGTGTDYDPETWCSTELTLEEDGNGGFTFRIHGAKGNTACIPSERSWRIEVYGVSSHLNAQGEPDDTKDNAPADAGNKAFGSSDQSRAMWTEEALTAPGPLVIELAPAPVTVERAVSIPAPTGNDWRREINILVDNAFMDNNDKMKYADLAERSASRVQYLSELSCDRVIPEAVRAAMEEILLS